jgi:hypothetical protein
MQESGKIDVLVYLVYNAGVSSVAHITEVTEE